MTISNEIPIDVRVQIVSVAERFAMNGRRANEKDENAVWSPGNQSK